MTASTRSGLTGVEPCSGVRLAGASDVSAFGVREDKETPLAGAGDESLQCGVAARPVGLRERDLGLEDGGLAVHRVDHGLAERVEAVGVVGQSPRLEQGRARVHTHAQRSMLLEGVRETPAEGHTTDRSAGCSHWFPRGSPFQAAVCRVRDGPPPVARYGEIMRAYQPLLQGDRQQGGLGSARR